MGNSKFALQRSKGSFHPLFYISPPTSEHVTQNYHRKTVTFIPRNISVFFRVLQQVVKLIVKLIPAGLLPPWLIVVALQHLYHHPLCVAVHVGPDGVAHALRNVVNKPSSWVLEEDGALPFLSSRILRKRHQAGPFCAKFNII